MEMKENGGNLCNIVKSTHNKVSIQQIESKHLNLPSGYQSP